jgi:hypothetical protein
VIFQGAAVLLMALLHGAPYAKAIKSGNTLGAGTSLVATCSLVVAAAMSL